MGFFDFFKKTSPKVEPVKKETPKVTPTVSGTTRNVLPIKLPTKKDGHPIQYAYVLDIDPADGVDLFDDIIQDTEKFVIPSPAGNEIILIYEDKLIGKISNPEKAKMLSDWIKKGFPYDAILRADGKTINLRFYRDKRTGNEYREQTVIAWTSYKSQAKQDALSFLEPGDALDLEENYGREDAVDVLYDGLEKIGSLPKKIAHRVLEEGAYGAFYEKSESQDTDDGEIIKPYIRIYW